MSIYHIPFARKAQNILLIPLWFLLHPICYLGENYLTSTNSWLSQISFFVDFSFHSTVFGEHWSTLLRHKVHPFQLCLLTVFEVISEQVLRMFTNSFFSQSGGSLCHGKICAHGPWVGPAFTCLCWNTRWGRYPGGSESFVASMQSVCLCCWEHTSTQAANRITLLQPVPPPLPCVLTHTHSHAHIDTDTNIYGHT